MWLLSCGGHGYAQGIWEGRVTVVHRLSYLAYRGSIPDGMVVMHKCDVRCCVNPDHLVVGTDAENAADKRRKGRHGNVGKVLTSEQRKALRTMPGTYEQVAGVIGCDVKTVWYYRKGPGSRRVA